MIRVSRCLAQAGLVDPQWFTQASRDRGTVVHAIGEATLLCQSIEFASAFNGYAHALRCGIAALQFVPICVERRLIDGDVTGRPDTIGLIHNPVGRLRAGPTIIDIKSGDKIAAHGIQLALYESLADATPDLRLALPPEYRDLPWQRVGLYVRDTGRYSLHPYLDDGDRLIAQAILDLTRWRIAHGLLDPGTVAMQDDDPTFLEEYHAGRTLIGVRPESPTASGVPPEVA